MNLYKDDPTDMLERAAKVCGLRRKDVMIAVKYKGTLACAMQLEEFKTWVARPKTDFLLVEEKAIVGFLYFDWKHIKAKVRRNKV